MQGSATDARPTPGAGESSGPVGLNTPLRQLVQRPPITVPLSSTVTEALQALDRGSGEALVVIDPSSGVPLGLLTLRDVLRRIALGGCDVQQPVATVMTGGLIALPAEASVHQATVLMVRRRLHHVVLTDSDGRLFNVVSQGELYGLQDAGSEALLQSVIDARDIATLAGLARDVRAVAVRRLAEGSSAEALCQWNSALNDLITLQVLDVVEGQHELPYIPWCWLVFGSQGRLEQTLVTDQDNGIIFAAESAQEAEFLRQRFRSFAQAVNQALDVCGFPLCKGNIMARNPQWCLSLDEWRSVFAGWVMEPHPDALLNSTIFFDFRPLYGAEDLATRLREALLSWTTSNPAFLRAMAQIALDIDPPLGWLRDFRFDDKAHPGTIDIKLRGTHFFVDIARIWALAEGVASTNTAERLRAVGAKRGRPVEESAAAVAAFYHILRLRLRREAAVGAEDGSHHRLAPRELHAIDRHILKEAFRQAKTLQELLRLEYRL